MLRIQVTLRRNSHFFTIDTSSSTTFVFASSVQSNVWVGEGWPVSNLVWSNKKKRKKETGHFFDLWHQQMREKPAPRCEIKVFFYSPSLHCTPEDYRAVANDIIRGNHFTEVREWGLESNKNSPWWRIVCQHACRNTEVFQTVLYKSHYRSCFLAARLYGRYWDLYPVPSSTQKKPLVLI